MLKTKKNKKYQFGGNLYNMIPDFKFFSYKPFYAEKDINTMGNIATQLQNVYDKRLEQKQAAFKAINDMSLNPLYKNMKQDMVQGLMKELDNGKDMITSDVYARKLIDVVGKTMADPKLEVAKANTEAYDIWQEEMQTLSQQGKYNESFDPNRQIYDRMKKGEGLYDVWDYKRIAPYFDYNAKLVDIATKVKEIKSISHEEINKYDWWLEKITEVPKDKVASFLQAQRDGFLESAEGQTFKRVVAKKHNLKLDSNGNPIEDQLFKDKINQEFATLVSGIAAGVSYKSVESAEIVTNRGALEYDTSLMDAQSRAAAAAKEKKSQDGYGLFQESTPGADFKSGTGPKYMIGTPGKSFDYKQSYNVAYEDYHNKFSSFQESTKQYTFKDNTGKTLSADELLDYYQNNGGDAALSNISIMGTDGKPITDDVRNTISSDLSRLLYTRSTVKAEAQYINAVDSDLKNRILSVQENGKTKYQFSKLNEDVQIGNGQTIKVTGKIERNGEILLFINDDDKGYKDKMLTPYEFKEMYNTLPSSISSAVGNNMIANELTINEQLKQKALDYAKNLPQFADQRVAEPTPEMLLAYRQSANYENDLKSIRNSVIGSGDGLYADYMNNRISALTEKSRTTYKSDNYYVLPELGSDKAFDRLNADVKAAKIDPNKNQYYMISENSDESLSPQTWEDVQRNIEGIRTKNRWWNDDFVRGSTLQIVGYDMNDRLGGVWVAKVGITDKELSTLLGNENEATADRYEEFRKSMTEGIQKGAITRDEANNMWVFNDTTLIMPNSNVTYNYFKAKYGDEKSSIDSGIQTYNAILEGFNNGKDVIVMPSADGNNNIIRQGSNGTYTYTYTTEYGTYISEECNSIEELVATHQNVNSAIIGNQSSFINSGYVQKAGNQTLSPKATSVANNILSKGVLPYISGFSMKKEFRDALKADPESAKMKVNVSDPNVINIAYSPSNYASKSVLNLLRQISCVTAVDEYGSPIFNNAYNTLSVDERQDLSDNPMTPIDITNPAQAAMIRKIFGTDNISFAYPDNGNSNAIVITIN